MRLLKFDCTDNVLELVMYICTNVTQYIVIQFTGKIDCILGLRRNEGQLQHRTLLCFATSNGVKVMIAF